MANNSTTVLTIRGKSQYCKLLGGPTGNPFDENLNWTTDIKITPAVVKELKAAGIANKVKQKDNYLDGEPYISFKHPEFRRNGDRNDPIPVVDIIDEPWDDTKLIGNDSDVEVRFAIVDSGRPNKGVYLRKMRVLRHVPYNRSDFEEIQEDDEFAEEAKKARAAKQDGPKLFRPELPDNVEDDFDDSDVL